MMVQGHERAVAPLPGDGVCAHSMKRFDTAAFLLFAFGLIALTGCEDSPWHIDPLDTNARDGGGQPLNYSTLMRIGAAAHAGGDLATAVGLYRRASAVDSHAAAPLVASGNTLLEMGKIDEAIVAYNSALAREPHDPEALRGLARGYLMTGKPELAGQPLAVAFEATPDDPKLLLLIGVADDFVGQHEEAQARYRRGLELAPGDSGLSVDLALSLALSGNYPEAINVLRPVAQMTTAGPRERQTLALIYGLQGNSRAAQQVARVDLDPASVQRNLVYYDNLRRLSPEARQRAIQSLTMQGSPHQF
ncbi:MAG TPA: tetratricopeptide repeat protein [Stellaceae bacterium]|jgi:Flp pilus assembly protein TadD|nr:tetratricopeptide repeat protein [Stellaceae bacterium]